jgi:hypothetical protein
MIEFRMTPNGVETRMKTKRIISMVVLLLGAVMSYCVGYQQGVSTARPLAISASSSSPRIFVGEVRPYARNLPPISP